MTTGSAPADNRLERILAYMVAAIVGASVLAFIAVIVATTAGVGENDGFSQGIWPFVIVFPMVGLPIGFVLLLTLIIINGVRRSRAARRDGNGSAKA